MHAAYKHYVLRRLRVLWFRHDSEAIEMHIQIRTWTGTSGDKLLKDHNTGVVYLLVRC